MDQDPGRVLEQVQVPEQEQELVPEQELEQEQEQEQEPLLRQSFLQVPEESLHSDQD